MRKLIGMAALAVMASGASAQGTAPAGWHLRTDTPKENPANIAFTKEGEALHVVAGGSHAIYWHDGMGDGGGKMVISATFTQMKAPQYGHPEAYGIFWGGSDLTGDKVTYLYFVIRGDGKYLVVHRADATTTHTITDWTVSPAINAQDANGKQVNKLSVQMDADSVRLFANGKRVAAYDKGVATPGAFGFRIGHALDIKVEGFAKEVHK